jgi:small subunit ribosomal protein S6
MRIYELVYIVKPDLPEEDVDATVNLVREAIEGGGATVDKVDKWGKRRLAYRVRRFWDGYYVLVQYSVDGQEALPKEVERKLRVTDAVIKFLTVRIDEDIKRAEKLKAKRDSRGRRPSGGGGGGSNRPAPGNAPGAPSEPSDKDGESDES